MAIPSLSWMASGLPLPVRHRWPLPGWLRGMTILGGIVLVVLLAPIIAPADPTELFVGPKLGSPSLAHPLGTDLLGRDQLTRILYGGRSALGMAFLVVAMTIAIGSVIGSIAGYCGGRIDAMISIGLAMLLALPELSLTIAVIAIFGPGWGTLVLALTLTSWVGYARLFRGAVLATRQQPYVEAARAAGNGTARILALHIAPNVARPILALASLQFAGVMLAVAGLSFLGLGVQPPTADWGTMVNDARPFLRTSPHLAVAPALCIIFVAISANSVANTLLHPHRPSRIKHPAVVTDRSHASPTQSR